MKIRNRLEKTTTYQKKIRASTENLAEVRNFVSLHALEHGFSEQHVSDIRLAVDEACTNIIKHAYKYDDSKTLEIDLIFDQNRLDVILTDHGASFDPNRYEKPVLKDQIKQKKRGGMGVHLIRSLMDDVSYKVRNSKNILRMCKKRDGQV